MTMLTCSDGAAVHAMVSSASTAPCAQPMCAKYVYRPEPRDSESLRRVDDLQK